MYLDHVNQLITWLDSSMRDEFARNREENLRNSKDIREETLSSLKTFSDILSKSIADNGQVQRDQLFAMIQQLDKIRETVETRLKLLQDENARKLDEMRATVDEKLQTTLEKRLSE